MEEGRRIEKEGTKDTVICVICSPRTVDSSVIGHVIEHQEKSHLVQSFPHCCNIFKYSRGNQERKTKRKKRIRKREDKKKEG